MPKVYRIKNSNIAEIQNGKLVAKSAGQTSMSVYNDVVSDNTYLGQAQVNVTSQQEAVPTSGITISPSSVTLTYAYNVGLQLKATITPPSASSNDIVWTSSDKNIATVSKKGYVKAAKKKAGVATITATANGYTATCVVTVDASGTYIKSVSPIQLSVPATQRTTPIKVVQEVLGGYDSGYTVFAPLYDSVETSNETPTGFNLITPENWGNAREYTVYVHGNYNDDEGCEIKVSQAGSTKVKDFRDSDEGYVDSDGTPYLYGNSPFTGAIYYECAVGYGANILSNVTVSDSWIHLNTRNSGLVGLGTGYTAEQVNEYARYGTINGEDPHFQGKTATYYVQVTFDANNGSERTGTLTFPGNKVFTIHQDAESI